MILIKLSTENVRINGKVVQKTLVNFGNMNRVKRNIEITTT